MAKAQGQAATEQPEWQSAEQGTVWVVSGGGHTNTLGSVIADPAGGTDPVFEVLTGQGATVAMADVTDATLMAVVDAEWPGRAVDLGREHEDMRGRLAQLVDLCAGARTSDTLTAAALLDAIEPLLVSQLKP